MNKKILIGNLLSGFLVLFTYVIFLPKILNLNISLNKIWGNIKGTQRNLTYISMIISAISFLYIFRFFTLNKIKYNKIVNIGFIIFYIGAISWAPLLYNYFLNTNETNLLLMILSLCLTTFGIILLFIYIFSLKKNYLLKIAITLFLFHVLFLDNLNFSIHYLS